ncbi:MAG: 50S ribosomal protein L31 [Actinobacteria bacterium]|nr:50S ribosomal protein L31 [Actinomycetota bacterium]
MRADIHPNYVEASVTCSCGNSFTTHSTKDALSVELCNECHPFFTGKQKSIVIELCNECHPFFTGKQKLVDSGGRVDRFEKRYGARKAKRS